MDSLLSAARVLVALAVVFGLLWYLTRRLRNGRGPQRASTVRVLGKAGVGGKASVVVVEVEGRRMVLGVTEHAVAVLHDDEAPAETVAAHSAAPVPAPAPVTSLFSNAFSGRTQWVSPRRAAATAELGPRRLRRLAQR